MTEDPLHVAIIGGGLCGLALAIALSKRGISYTVYEAHSSFTEIGAGLNLGANGIHSFNAIDPDLSDKIFALATRNEPGEEDIILNLRLGAATEQFEDAHFIAGIKAPPSGNMTFSRNELLQLLAHAIPAERTRFEKRITDIQQSSNGVTMFFSDGSKAEASAVVACDGAHSAVRKIMLGPNHPAATAKFSGTAGYRGVLPMDLQEQAVGSHIAHNGHMMCGPGSCAIMYPINQGKDANIGLWVRKTDPMWNEPDHPWVLHQQKQQMLEDFKDWGPTLQKLMSFMSEETQLWGAYHYSTFPEHYFDGRVCLIGDAAHAMSPHQGQGACQAMEDASVMADTLEHVDECDLSVPLADRLQAAFHGFEAARRDRFEAVLRTSLETAGFWCDLHKPDLRQQDLEQYEKDAYERFEWMWNEDIVGQGRLAVAEMDKELLKTFGGKNEMNGDVNHSHSKDSAISPCLK